MSDFGHALQEWWPLVIVVVRDVFTLVFAIGTYLWRVIAQWT